MAYDQDGYIRRHLNYPRLPETTSHRPVLPKEASGQARR